MRAVLFDSIPFDYESRKTDSPSTTTLVGSGVYAAAMVRGLLRHGTCDRYYFIDRQRYARYGVNEWTQFRENRDRAHVIPPEEIPGVANEGPLVVASFGPAVTDLLPIRAICNRPDWPVTGITHSLHGRAFAGWMLQLLLDDVGPGDALICTSMAGKRVVLNVLDSIREKLLRKGITPPDLSVELPVIPLGVECEAASSGSRDSGRKLAGASEDETVLLYLGRFSSVSKCDLGPLLYAFSRLSRESRVRLVLSGDDTQFQMAPRLSELAGRLACADRVCILSNPSTRQKWDLLAAADVFVSPSDNIQETFGITIIEAMAAGLAVVASDWNGYRDLIDDGRTGYLIPTAIGSFGQELCGEAALASATVVEPHYLYRSVRELIVNPERRRAMGQAAKREANARFDWRVIIARYEELWSQLTQERRGRFATPSAGLTSLRLLEVFRHYPTSHWDEKLCVKSAQSREAGDHWDEASLAILRCARESNGILVRDLIENEALRRKWDRRRLAAETTRLLKYGVLSEVER
ncbi:MAG: glycosyltransferase family 4 protein [Bryobacteraceae bacterium]